MLNKCFYHSLKIILGGNDRGLSVVAESGSSGRRRRYYRHGQFGSVGRSLSFWHRGLKQKEYVDQRQSTCGEKEGIKGTDSSPR